MSLSTKAQLLFHFGIGVCVLMILISLTTSAFPAKAAEVSNDTASPTTDADRDDFKEAMRERRERYEMAQARVASTTEKVRERILERRALLTPGVKERVKNLFDNVKNRMYATTERFLQISDRIEARATLLSDQGADVSAVMVALTTARNEIELARAQIQQAGEAEVDTVIDNEQPRERFVILRDRVRAIHGHLIASQAALRTALAALKDAADTNVSRGVSEAVSNTPTTTAATTTNPS